MGDDTRSTGSDSSRRDFLRTAATTASGAVLGGLALQSGVHAAGSDTIKIGMVGAGGRCTGAAMNAMNVDKGARLVAIGDIFMDRVHAKRAALKAKKPDQVAVPDSQCFAGFDAYKKVIACADVVLIANAAKFHPLHALAAIQAGKSVFVEKPHGIDPAGVKMIAQACALATQKGLSVVSGLQSRFNPGYRAMMQKIHDGAIGDIVAIEEHYLRGPYGLRPRKPGLTEVQYQCSNQYHFTWLSGDDVPQSLIHNLDRSLWAMGDKPPARCHAVGGRSSSVGEVYGDVFDHNAVVYEYANGVKIYAICRTQVGCFNRVSSIIMGTKGRCNVFGYRIEGETPWHYKGPRVNPYDAEQKALLDAVRSGKPINSGHHMARSTLVTVMGQMASYTGKRITWAEAEKSDYSYPPAPSACTMDMDPPVKPGPDGCYPVRVPGKTKLL